VNNTPNAGHGVVVVDRRPLERKLVRFILQENGFEVLAEAATPAEAIRAVERRPPAVVVLHENAAWENGQPTIPLLRDVLPEGRILIITPAFGVVRVELLRDADAVLEEGVGFKDLPFVMGRLIGGDAAPVAPHLAVVPPPPVPAPHGRGRERWVNRIQGATAAAAVFLALVFARAAMPPGPEGVRTVPAVALQQAQNSLEALQAATESPPDRLIQQALILAEDRAAAIDAGADVSSLDARIADLVEQVLPTLPAEAARTLLWLFSDVAGVSSPTPTATLTPTPQPTQGSQPRTSTQEPSPTEPPIVVVLPTSETPAPEDTQTPSPTDTGTPSPTETPSPSPNDTESPPPTETQTQSPVPTDTASETETPSPPETASPSVSESPSQTESPSPSETETPGPTESESPSQTESPSPSETETPSPTESESPTPTESPSPSPTETESDADTEAAAASPGGGAGASAVFFVPGVGLFASVLARRRARRARD
jgi:hypothetical protein